MMKKVVLYDPSLSTVNMGDMIIYESVHQHILPILQDAFPINVSTHLPVSYTYAAYLKDADYKFVCGTNLLRNNLNSRFRQWNINMINVGRLGPCTLIGVGWQQDGKPLTAYTKRLYQKILSRDTIHSVRDEYTKQRLQEIGFTNVINTGCATMWNFSAEKCGRVPHEKQKNVVFTVTDYNKDQQKDTEIIETLCGEYEKVYIWLQGIGDYRYLKNLGVLDKITVIPPMLSEYDRILERDDIEYIGTRLHGGIRALQHEKRTMILAVDGRAQEKKKDFHLPVTVRNDITKETMLDMIYRERKTEIVIPEENIKKWKAQFGLD